MRIDTARLEQYEAFVRNRHQLWEARQLDLPPESWTTDPILQTRKFTNAFRVLDYGTQFVVKELMYDDDPEAEDVILRAWLYRMTNRPEPYVWYKEQTGHYPTFQDLLYGRLRETWSVYRHQLKLPMFGFAYKAHRRKGIDAMSSILNTADAELTENIAWLGSTRTIAERLEIFQQVPLTGPFIAMQVATDMGYSDPLQTDENETVLPGPGCVRGVAQVTDTEDVVGFLHREQDALADVTIDLGSGRHRSLSLMDIQNTFCEFQKYVRYTELPPRDKAYAAKHPAEEPFYPPHWKGTD